MLLRGQERAPLRVRSVSAQGVVELDPYAYHACLEDIPTGGAVRASLLHSVSTGTILSSDQKTLVLSQTRIHPKDIIRIATFWSPVLSVTYSASADPRTTTVVLEDAPSNVEIGSLARVESARPLSLRARRDASRTFQPVPGAPVGAAVVAAAVLEFVAGDDVAAGDALLVGGTHECTVASYNGTTRRATVSPALPDSFDLGTVTTLTREPMLAGVTEGPRTALFVHPLVAGTAVTIVDVHGHDVSWSASVPEATTTPGSRSLSFVEREADTVTVAINVWDESYHPLAQRQVVVGTGEYVTILDAARVSRYRVDSYSEWQVVENNAPMVGPLTSADTFELESSGGEVHTFAPGAMRLYGGGSRDTTFRLDATRSSSSVLSDMDSASLGALLYSQIELTRLATGTAADENKTTFHAVPTSTESGSGDRWTLRHEIYVETQDAPGELIAWETFYGKTTTATAFNGTVLAVSSGDDILDKYAVEISFDESTTLMTVTEATGIFTVEDRSWLPTQGALLVDKVSVAYTTSDEGALKFTGDLPASAQTFRPGPPVYLLLSAPESSAAASLRLTSVHEVGALVVTVGATEAEVAVDTMNAEDQVLRVGGSMDHVVRAGSVRRTDPANIEITLETPLMLSADETTPVQFLVTSDAPTTRLRADFNTEELEVESAAAFPPAGGFFRLEGVVHAYTATSTSAVGDIVVASAGPTVPIIGPVPGSSVTWVPLTKTVAGDSTTETITLTENIGQWPAPNQQSLVRATVRLVPNDAWNADVDLHFTGPLFKSTSQTLANICVGSAKRVASPWTRDADSGTLSLPLDSAVGMAVGTLVSIRGGADDFPDLVPILSIVGNTISIPWNRTSPVYDASLTYEVRRHLLETDASTVPLALSDSLALVPTEGTSSDDLGGVVTLTGAGIFDGIYESGTTDNCTLLPLRRWTGLAFELAPNAMRGKSSGTATLVSARSVEMRWAETAPARTAAIVAGLDGEKVLLGDRATTTASTVLISGTAPAGTVVRVQEWINVRASGADQPVFTHLGNFTVSIIQPTSTTSRAVLSGVHHDPDRVTRLTVDDAEPIDMPGGTQDTSWSYQFPLGDELLAQDATEAATRLLVRKEFMETGGTNIDMLYLVRRHVPSVTDSPGPGFWRLIVMDDGLRDQRLSVIKNGAVTEKIVGVRAPTGVWARADRWVRRSLVTVEDAVEPVLLYVLMIIDLNGTVEYAEIEAVRRFHGCTVHDTPAFDFRAQGHRRDHMDVTSQWEVTLGDRQASLRASGYARARVPAPRIDPATRESLGAQLRSFAYVRRVPTRERAIYEWRGETRDPHALRAGDVVRIGNLSGVVQPMFLGVRSFMLHSSGEFDEEIAAAYEEDDGSTFPPMLTEGENFLVLSGDGTVARGEHIPFDGDVVVHSRLESSGATSEGTVVFDTRARGDASSGATESVVVTRPHHVKMLEITSDCTGIVGFVDPGATVLLEIVHPDPGAPHTRSVVSDPATGYFEMYSPQTNFYLTARSESGVRSLSVYVNDRRVCLTGLPSVPSRTTVTDSLIPYRPLVTRGPLATTDSGGAVRSRIDGSLVGGGVVTVAVLRPMSTAQSTSSNAIADPDAAADAGGTFAASTFQDGTFVVEGSGVRADEPTFVRLIQRQENNDVPSYPSVVPINPQIKNNLKIVSLDFATGYVVVEDLDTSSPATSLEVHGITMTREDSEKPWEAHLDPLPRASIYKVAIVASDGRERDVWMAGDVRSIRPVHVNVPTDPEALMRLDGIDYVRSSGTDTGWRLESTETVAQSLTVGVQSVETDPTAVLRNDGASLYVSDEPGAIPSISVEKNEAGHLTLPLRVKSIRRDGSDLVVEVYSNVDIHTGDRFFKFQLGEQTLKLNEDETPRSHAPELTVSGREVRMKADNAVFGNLLLLEGSPIGKDIFQVRSVGERELYVTSSVRRTDLVLRRRSVYLESSSVADGSTYTHTVSLDPFSTEVTYELFIDHESKAVVTNPSSVEYLASGLAWSLRGQGMHVSHTSHTSPPTLTLTGVASPTLELYIHEERLPSVPDLYKRESNVINSSGRFTYIVDVTRKLLKGFPYDINGSDGIFGISATFTSVGEYAEAGSHASRLAAAFNAQPENWDELMSRIMNADNLRASGRILLQASVMRRFLAGTETLVPSTLRGQPLPSKVTGTHRYFGVVDTNQKYAALPVDVFADLPTNSYPVLEAPRHGLLHRITFDQTGSVRLENVSVGMQLVVRREVELERLVYEFGDASSREIGPAYDRFTVVRERGQLQSAMSATSSTVDVTNLSVLPSMGDVLFIGNALERVVVVSRSGNTVAVQRDPPPAGEERPTHGRDTYVYLACTIQIDLHAPERSADRHVAPASGPGTVAISPSELVIPRTFTTQREPTLRGYTEIATARPNFVSYVGTRFTVSIPVPRNRMYALTHQYSDKRIPAGWTRIEEIVASQANGGSSEFLPIRILHSTVEGRSDESRSRYAIEMDWDVDVDLRIGNVSTANMTGKTFVLRGVVRNYYSMAVKEETTFSLVVTGSLPQGPSFDASSEITVSPEKPVAAIFPRDTTYTGATSAPVVFANRGASLSIPVTQTHEVSTSTGRVVRWSGNTMRQTPALFSLSNTAPDFVSISDGVLHFHSSRIHGRFLFDPDDLTARHRGLQRFTDSDGHQELIIRIFVSSEVRKAANQIVTHDDITYSTVSLDERTHTWTLRSTKPVAAEPGSESSGTLHIKFPLAVERNTFHFTIYGADVPISVELWIRTYGARIRHRFIGGNLYPAKVYIEFDPSFRVEQLLHLHSPLFARASTHDVVHHVAADADTVTVQSRYETSRVFSRPHRAEVPERVEESAPAAPSILTTSSARRGGSVLVPDVAVRVRDPTTIFAETNPRVEGHGLGTVAFEDPFYATKTRLHFDVLRPNVLRGDMTLRLHDPVIRDARQVFMTRRDQQLHAGGRTYSYDQVAGGGVSLAGITTFEVRDPRNAVPEVFTIELTTSESVDRDMHVQAQQVDVDVDGAIDASRAHVPFGPELIGDYNISSFTYLNFSGSRAPNSNEQATIDFAWPTDIPSEDRDVRFLHLPIFIHQDDNLRVTGTLGSAALIGVTVDGENMSTLENQLLVSSIASATSTAAREYTFTDVHGKVAVGGMLFNGTTGGTVVRCNRGPRIKTSQNYRSDQGLDVSSFEPGGSEVLLQFTASCRVFGSSVSILVGGKLLELNRQVVAYLPDMFPNNSVAITFNQTGDATLPEFMDPGQYDDTRVCLVVEVGENSIIQNPVVTTVWGRVIEAGGYEVVDPITFVVRFPENLQATRQGLRVPNGYVHGKVGGHNSSGKRLVVPGHAIRNIAANAQMRVTYGAPVHSIAQEDATRDLRILCGDVGVVQGDPLPFDVTAMRVTTTSPHNFVSDAMATAHAYVDNSVCTVRRFSNNAASVEVYAMDRDRLLNDLAGTVDRVGGEDVSNLPQDSQTYGMKLKNMDAAEQDVGYTTTNDVRGSLVSDGPCRKLRLVGNLHVSTIDYEEHIMTLWWTQGHERLLFKHQRIKVYDGPAEYAYTGLLVQSSGFEYAAVALESTVSAYVYNAETHRLRIQLSAARFVPTVNSTISVVNSGAYDGTHEVTAVYSTTEIEVLMRSDPLDVDVTASESLVRLVNPPHIDLTRASFQYGPSPPTHTQVAMSYINNPLTPANPSEKLWINGVETMVTRIDRNSVYFQIPRTQAPPSYLLAVRPDKSKSFVYRMRSNANGEGSVSWLASTGDETLMLQMCYQWFEFDPRRVARLGSLSSSAGLPSSTVASVGTCAVRRVEVILGATGDTHTRFTSRRLNLRETRDFVYDDDTGRLKVSMEGSEAYQLGTMADGECVDLRRSATVKILSSSSTSLSIDTPVAEGVTPEATISLEPTDAVAFNYTVTVPMSQLMPGEHSVAISATRVLLDGTVQRQTVFSLPLTTGREGMNLAIKRDGSSHHLMCSTNPGSKVWLHGRGTRLIAKFPPNVSGFFHTESTNALCQTLTILGVTPVIRNGELIRVQQKLSKDMVGDSLYFGAEYPEYKIATVDLSQNTFTFTGPEPDFDISFYRMVRFGRWYDEKLLLGLTKYEFEKYKARGLVGRSVRIRIKKKNYPTEPLNASSVIGFVQNAHPSFDYGIVVTQPAGFSFSGYLLPALGDILPAEAYFPGDSVNVFARPDVNLWLRTAPGALDVMPSPSGVRVTEIPLTGVIVNTLTGASLAVGDNVISEDMQHLVYYPSAIEHVRADAEKRIVRRLAAGTNLLENPPRTATSTIQFVHESSLTAPRTIASRVGLRRPEDVGLEAVPMPGAPATLRHAFVDAAHRIYFDGAPAGDEYIWGQWTSGQNITGAQIATGPESLRFRLTVPSTPPVTVLTNDTILLQERGDVVDVVRLDEHEQILTFEDALPYDVKLVTQTLVDGTIVTGHVLRATVTTLTVRATGGIFASAQDVVVDRTHVRNVEAVQLTNTFYFSSHLPASVVTTCVPSYPIKMNSADRRPLLVDTTLVGQTVRALVLPQHGLTDNDFVIFNPLDGNDTLTTTARLRVHRLDANQVEVSREDDTAETRIDPRKLLAAEHQSDRYYFLLATTNHFTIPLWNVPTHIVTLQRRVGVGGRTGHLRVAQVAAANADPIPLVRDLQITGEGKARLRLMGMRPQDEVKLTLNSETPLNVVSTGAGTIEQTFPQVLGFRTLHTVKIEQTASSLTLPLVRTQKHQNLTVNPLPTYTYEPDHLLTGEWYDTSAGVTLSITVKSQESDAGKLVAVIDVARAPSAGEPTRWGQLITLLPTTNLVYVRRGEQSDSNRPALETATYFASQPLHRDLDLDMLVVRSTVQVKTSDAVRMNLESAHVTLDGIYRGRLRPDEGGTLGSGYLPVPSRPNTKLNVVVLEASGQAHTIEQEIDTSFLLPPPVVSTLQERTYAEGMVVEKTGVRLVDKLGVADVTIAGSGRIGDIVYEEIHIYDGTTRLAVGKCDENDTWSTACRFYRGAYSLSVVGIDAAGRHSMPLTIAFEVETATRVRALATSNISPDGTRYASFSHDGTTQNLTRTGGKHVTLSAENLGLTRDDATDEKSVNYVFWHLGKSVTAVDTSSKKATVEAGGVQHLREDDRLYVNGVFAYVDRVDDATSFTYRGNTTPLSKGEIYRVLDFTSPLSFFTDPDTVHHFTVGAEPDNDNPTVTLSVSASGTIPSIPDQQASEGQLFSYTVPNAKYIDVQNSLLPSWLRVEGATLRGTPTQEHVGATYSSYTLRVLPGGASILENHVIRIKVNNVASKPVVSGHLTSTL